MRSHPAAGVILLTVISSAILAACGTGSGPGATAVASTRPVASSTPAAVPTVAAYACGPRALTWDGHASIDLTGTWSGDDGGVYYFRQISDQIWWLGMSGIGGPLVRRGVDWTNVYRGTLAGDTITGTYADVPQGKVMDQGPVVLKLTPTAGGITLARTDPLLETGFGGTLLTPCSLA